MVFLSDASVNRAQVVEIVKGNEVYLSDREIHSGVLWRVDSKVDENSSVLDQVRSIISIISFDSFKKYNELFEKIYFDIAIYHNTYTCSLNLSGECLKLITGLDPEIGIELTCYPAEED